MQTLNLIRPNESDISYEIIHFPDGEVHIKLGEFSRKDKVEVICRTTNAEDLFILMQVGDILNRHEIDWSLKIFYLMSMRMDRVISFNGAFSLKVVLNEIKDLCKGTIEIACPHSDKYLNIIGNNGFAMFENPEDLGIFDLNKYQLCYPDVGAKDRFDPYFMTNALIGKKVRNTDTGKIESIIIENPQDYNGDPILVVDDLCDAGGTFIGIAEAIRTFAPDAEINIQVFHMVNRKGIENLSEHYDRVIFTNSYKDWDNLPSNCKMIKVC